MSNEQELPQASADDGATTAGAEPSPSSAPHLDPTPLNDLEAALEAASKGETDSSEPVLVFLNSLVCLLVPEPVPGQTEYVEPLVLTNSEGNPLVAAFTDTARIRSDFLEHAPTVVTTQGAVLLQNLGSELGVVLNPGSAFGFELAAEQVAAILNDFRPATEEEIEAARDSDSGTGRE
ncbi:SseB family protein [Sinomonas susongensis]|uniref:SseB family protein n=1 Tax=Sinomonas susongensis TaxID=1324851 RepID=UPI001108F0DB|nr:SseB family protein [Sinomonas susongensis]